MFYRQIVQIFLFTETLPLSYFVLFGDLCSSAVTLVVSLWWIRFIPACLTSQFLSLFPFCLCSPADKWYKRHLTYQIVNWPRHLSLGSVRLAVRAAFQLWSNVSGLVFQEVPEGPADIRLAFYDGDHNDGASNAFDGPGQGHPHSDPSVWSILLISVCVVIVLYYDLVYVICSPASLAKEILIQTSWINKA